LFPQLFKESALNENDVLELMKSSKSEQEWNANCDKVKEAFGGYPSWRYAKIVMSGIMKQTAATW